MLSPDQLPPEDLPFDNRRERPYSSDFEHVFEVSSAGAGLRGARAKGGEPRPGGGPHYQHKGYRVRPRPENDMQALMEAAPFEEPEVSKDENLPLKDAIADAIDSLPERSRWIFEKVHYEGYGLRELAGVMSLSKTQVHRLYQAALVQLRETLTERFDIQP